MFVFNLFMAQFVRCADIYLYLKKGTMYFLCIVCILTLMFVLWVIIVAVCVLFSLILFYILREHSQTCTSRELTNPHKD